VHRFSTFKDSFLGGECFIPGVSAVFVPVPLVEILAEVDQVIVEAVCPELPFPLVRASRIFPRVVALTHFKTVFLIKFGGSVLEAFESVHEVGSKVLIINHTEAVGGDLVRKCCEVRVTDSVSSNIDRLCLDSVLKQLHREKLRERTTKTVSVNLDDEIRVLGLESQDFFKDLRVDSVNTSIDASVHFAVALRPRRIVNQLAVEVHLVVGCTYSASHDDVDSLFGLHKANKASNVVVLPVERLSEDEAFSHVLEFSQLPLINGAELYIFSSHANRPLSKVM